MGYGIMVYAVDLDKVTAACGSGNNTMRRAIKGRFRSAIASTDQQLDLSSEDGGPSVFAAIDHLIMGSERPFPGFVYAYAYKYIVEHFGRSLDNGLFYPARGEFFSSVDSQLKAAGCRVELSELMTYSAPVSFPMPNDFPYFGWWSAQECAASLVALRACGSKTCEMTAIERWLADVAAKGEGIVGFYH
jgi:hypothetical protein